jgi:molybdate transport system substrate-binding protein
MTAPVPLAGISSMATRQLLAELAAAYAAAGGQSVRFESVGGVDAAERVNSGEPFDLVVLAADAIDRLAAAGHVAADSVTALVRSEVAVAVREGAPQPDIGCEAALRRAVLAARTLGYSTGPSGTALLALFEGLGIAEAVRERLVQAPAGVPVGALVARGDVELGFQQSSELMNLAGVAVIGPLPEPVQIVTTFSGAACRASSRAEDARSLLLRAPHRLAHRSRPHPRASRRRPARCALRRLPAGSTGAPARASRASCHRPAPSMPTAMSSGRASSSRSRPSASTRPATRARPSSSRCATTSASRAT